MYLARFVIPSVVVYVISAFSFAHALDETDIALARQQQAEALEQQKNRDERLAQEQLPDVSVSLPIPTTKPSDLKDDYQKVADTCFPINQIHLIGESAEQFNFALTDVRYGHETYLGKCIGIEQINNIVSKVQNTIIDRGYVTTRVLVPQQNLKSGYLKLQVVAGRVGRVVAKDGGTLQQSYANQLLIKENDLLNIRHLEQGLENLKRTPSTSVDFKITPSENINQPGYSDIVVDWQKISKPYRLSLSIDDSGSKSTGKYQGNITLAFDNLAGLNDILYLGYNHDLGGKLPGARGTEGYNIGYSLPIGYWQFEASLSQYDYFQSPNETVTYSGDSRNVAFDVSRVVSRNADSKTKLEVGLWQKQTRNYVNDTLIEVQRRDTNGWHIGLNHNQKISHISLDATLDYRKPTAALNARPAPEELFGEGDSRAGVFSSAVELSGMGRLVKHPILVRSKLKAQFANDTLTPADRMTIGGRYTVRGFNGNRTLSGDRGWILQNELSVPIGQSPMMAYLAVDAGAVYMKNSTHESNIMAGNYLPANNLLGSALGFRGQVQGFNFDLFVGLPITQPKHFGPEKELATGFSIGYQSH